MAKHLVKLSLTCFLFCLCYSMSAQASPPPPTVAMPTPDGYTAIIPSSLPHSHDHFTPLALEMALRGDTLLRVYGKKMK